MKRELIFSLLLHGLLLVFALVFIPLKGEELRKPFYAQIITPEEMETQKAPVPIKPPPKRGGKRMVTPPPPPRESRRKIFIPPKLPENTPAPKELSAAPKQQRQQEGRSQETSPAREKPSGSPAKGGLEKAAKGLEVPSAAGPQNTPGQGKKGEESSEKAQSSKYKSKTLKEKLFDKDVLSMLSREGKTTRKGTSNGNMTIDLADAKYYGYVQMFWSKFIHEWREPSVYERGSEFGDVAVLIVINKNGYLKTVDLMRTSGHQRLDDETIRIIKRMEPFWPLPDSWHEDKLEIRLTIDYPRFDPRYQQALERYLSIK